MRSPALAVAFTVALVLVSLLSAVDAAAAAGWPWPVRGELLTGYRNGADPYAAGQHRGIDIAANVGEPVVASAPGTVTFAGVAGSSGLTVTVETIDGRLETTYLHLSAAAVRKGDQVAVGARIGDVGMTGRRSAERPHLHFGVREAGRNHAYRDPLEFLGPAPGGQPREPLSPWAPIAAPPRLAPVPTVVPGSVPHPSPAGRQVRAPRGIRVPAAGRLPRRWSPRPLPPPHLRPARRPANAAVPIQHAGVASGLARGSRAPGLRPSGLTPREAPPHSGPQPEHSPRALHLGSAPSAGPAPAGASGDSDRAHGRAGPVGRTRGRLDVGWLVACIGLVLAATALGRPIGARALARRGRAAVIALARPRVGRG